MSVHPEGTTGLPTPDEYRAAYQRLRLGPHRDPDAARRDRHLCEAGALAVMAEVARISAVATHRDTLTQQALRLVDLTTAIRHQEAS